MDYKAIRLIAMDMDGTLTQHKTPLEDMNRRALDALGQKYHLLMVGAGQCTRIFNQLGGYPIDIVGNYGMQVCEYDHETKTLNVVRDSHVDCDREETERRVTELRQRFGFTEFTGDNVEYHVSGCITFPILGTKADLKDKLAYDPDRSKRRAIYQQVIDMFPEYHVFVGGTSSFDMAPRPYNKLHGLLDYCHRHGYQPHEVLFIGDDYGQGGNDEDVYLSEVPFLTIDDYTTFAQKVEPLLK